MQDSQKELQDWQKDYQDLEKEFQDSQRDFEDSQVEFQVSQQESQASHEELQDNQKQRANYESAIEGLRLRLFYKCGKAKEYAEAEEIYGEIIENYKEATPPEPEAVLKMKYSFADLLLEQGKSQQAKEIASDVWRTRRDLDLFSEEPNTVSEETKRSHRQICLVYTSLEDFAAVEKQQRSVYKGEDEEPKDAWMLENGDALCSTLKRRKEYEKAAELQFAVWKERRRLGNYGPWDEYTIQSALSCIDLIECTLKDSKNRLSKHTGHEEERKHIRDRMQCHENDIFVMLQDVWANARTSERRPEILQVGHELGSRLIALEKYAKAEIILNDVWEARTTLFSEANQWTMQTGRLLADAIKLQESPQKYKSAATLYRRLLDQGIPTFGENDDRVISVGVALAETLFLDGQYADPDGAEQICRWVLEQKTKNLSLADPQVHDARYQLGKAIHAQGRERYLDCAPELQKVYDSWNKDLPKASATVECARLLVKAYEEYGGLDALEPIRTLFNGLSEQDVLYLESGHLLGKLLLRQGDSEGARELLCPLWGYQVGLPEEKRVHLRCGQLYGQSLLQCRQYRSAKGVLESVERAVPGVFGEDSPEGDEVTRVLQRARRGPREIYQRRPGRILRRFN